MLKIEQILTDRHLKHLERLLEFSRELTFNMSLEQLLHLITEAQWGKTAWRCGRLF